uniref:Uncharacterized protein n=1 Tax=Magallana gigas TaxID=29159 RepID=K1PI29_MAGGI
MPPDGSSGNTGMIVGIAIGVLLAVIAAVVAVDIKFPVVKIRMSKRFLSNDWVGILAHLGPIVTVGGGGVKSMIILCNKLNELYHSKQECSVSRD